MYMMGGNEIKCEDFNIQKLFLDGNFNVGLQVWSDFHVQPPHIMITTSQNGSRKTVIDYLIHNTSYFCVPFYFDGRYLGALAEVFLSDALQPEMRSFPF